MIFQNLYNKELPTTLEESQRNVGQGQPWDKWITDTPAGIILSVGLANERRRYIVTPPLIGWAHYQKDPCPIYQWTFSSPLLTKTSASGLVKEQKL